MHLLLTGFFGEGNLGDEAMLRGIMTAAGPHVSCFVTAGRLPLPGPVRRLPRRGITGWIGFLRTLPSVRRVVFLGGILQDWSFEGVTFYALRLMAARLAGKRPGIWGAGLGPLRRPAARALAEKALSGIRTAWLRDEDSRRLFADLTGREASLGVDWSWATPFSARPCPRDVPPVTEAPLGINLRPWFSPCWEETVRRRLALSQAAGPLLGIAARDEDRRLLTRLLPDLPVRQPADFSDLMSLCATLREGWAMRYHVLLAMLRAGIPVVPLPYDEKARSLCREAGVDDGIDPATEVPAQRPCAEFLPMMETRFTAMREAFATWLGTHPTGVSGRPGKPTPSRANP